MITAEYLKQHLHYDPGTGIFTRVKLNPRAKNLQRLSKQAGTKVPNGYIKIVIDKIPYAAHRLAWLYMTGEFPNTMLDHIDRDKQNNRWDNLRLSNAKDNHKNSMQASCFGVGITFVNETRRFRLRINGMHHGYFKTLEEAKAAKERILKLQPTTNQRRTKCLQVNSNLSLPTPQSVRLKSRSRCRKVLTLPS